MGFTSMGAFPRKTFRANSSGQTVDRIRKSYRDAKRYGVITMAYMIGLRLRTPPGLGGGRWGEKVFDVFVLFVISRIAAMFKLLR